MLTRMREIYDETGRHQHRDPGRARPHRQARDERRARAHVRVLHAVAEPGARHQAVRDRPRGRDHLRRDRDPGAARAVADEDPRRLELVAARSRRRRCCSCASPSRREPAYDADVARSRLGHVCGICGIVSSRGRVDRKRLAAMSATLVHRGPDSDGTFVKGGVGLAARRLAIIDLESGDQPISNEDGSVHGRPERRDLQLRRAAPRARSAPGTDASDHSDTETIVHAYEQWGLGFAERLRGMFAIAIWDAPSQAARAGARPVRDQAALLPRRRRRALVRLGARRAAEGRPRPRRARGVPGHELRAGAALDLPRDPQAAAGPRAHVGGRELVAGAVRPAGAAAGARTTTRRSCSRSAARGCATRCARTSSRTCRWACSCRAASTRGR